MVKFALFGAGRIGVLHAANIAASHPRASLAYVYDTNPAAAQAVAARHDAKIAASVEAALADPAVDAVLIASSTNTHVELITAAARAGKAILCEKPIDLDIARVERCRSDIAGCGVPVQIAFNRRYDAQPPGGPRRGARRRDRRAGAAGHHQPRSRACRRCIHLKGRAASSAT